MKIIKSFIVPPVEERRKGASSAQPSSQAKDGDEQKQRVKARRATPRAWMKATSVGPWLGQQPTRTKAVSPAVEGYCASDGKEGRRTREKCIHGLHMS